MKFIYLSISILVCVTLARLSLPSINLSEDGSLVIEINDGSFDQLLQSGAFPDYDKKLADMPIHECSSQGVFGGACNQQCSDTQNCQCSSGLFGCYCECVSIRRKSHRGHEHNEVES